MPPAVVAAAAAGLVALSSVLLVFLLVVVVVLAPTAALVVAAEASSAASSSPAAAAAFSTWTPPLPSVPPQPPHPSARAPGHAEAGGGLLAGRGGAGALVNLSSAVVLFHARSLLALSDAREPYEESRRRAVHYMTDALTGDTPSPPAAPELLALSGEQIAYHRFVWTDTVGDPSSGQEHGFAATWSGTNIIACTNATALNHTQRFHIVSARYDSLLWWNYAAHARWGQLPCSTVPPEIASLRLCARVAEDSLPVGGGARLRSAELYEDMLPAAFLLQFARAVLTRQAELKQAVESKTPLELLQNWRPGDVRSIETGIFRESPVCFVWFDHEAVGNVGSQAWSLFYNLPELVDEDRVASFSVIALDGPQAQWTPHNPSEHGEVSWRVVSPSFGGLFGLPEDWVNSLFDAD